MKWIKNGLLRAMSHVALGNKEKIRVSLFQDNIYNKAKDILLDMNSYYDIFNPIQNNTIDNIVPDGK